MDEELIGAIEGESILSVDAYDLSSPHLGNSSYEARIRVVPNQRQYPLTTVRREDWLIGHLQYFLGLEVAYARRWYLVSQ